MSHNVTLASLVHISPELLASKVKSEQVLLDVENGTYYGLNDIGSRIYELIQQPCSVQSVCSQLQSEYDVETEQCQAHVLEFLQRMVELDVLKISSD